MKQAFRPTGRPVLLALAAAALLAMSAGLAEAACLGRGEARAAIASGQAVPMGRIVAVLRQRYGVDVVDGALCEGGGGYVYRLTILTRRGKVRTVTIDARSGQPRGGNFD